MKPVIFLAEGFEESEALLPLDILRRGGIDAITVSVTSEKIVKSSHGVQIVADATMEEITAADVQMIILPGGLPGATNLDACAALDKMIMDFAAQGKPMAAICAAPMVYGKRGLLKGKKATCYRKGPAAAAEFGFSILEKLAGLEKADEVRKGMLYI